MTIGRKGLVSSLLVATSVLAMSAEQVWAEEVTDAPAQLVNQEEASPQVEAETYQAAASLPVESSQLSSSQEQEDNQVRFHVQAPEADAGLGLWTWGDVAEESAKKGPWPAGASALSEAKHIWNKDPRDVVMVAVTPCTAKIYEASRPEFVDAWKWNVEHGYLPKDTPAFPDIDYSLTTRDIAELLRRKGINPLTMPKTHEVKTMEKYTGAGTIFGCSGGVMEAALRTAYAILSGEELKDPDIITVRGMNNSLVAVP